MPEPATATVAPPTESILEALRDVIDPELGINSSTSAWSTESGWKAWKAKWRSST